MQAISLAEKESQKEMGLGNLISPNVGVGLLISLNIFPFTCVTGATEVGCVWVVNLA